MLGFLPAFAAEAAATKPVTVHMVIQNVSERRPSRGTGTLTVNFALFTTGVGPRATLRGIRITWADDPQGRRLPLLGPYFFDRPAIGRAPAANPMLNGSITMPGLPRGIGSVRNFEGTAELFVPSPDNGSMVTIPDIATHAGKIEHPGLTAHGIEFHVLNREQWTERLRSQGRLRTLQPNADFVAVVGDPSGRVIGYELIRPDGQVHRIQEVAREVGGPDPAVQMTGRAEIPAGTSLVIYVAVPGSIVTAPFRVDSLELP